MGRYPMRDAINKYVANKDWKASTKKERVRKFKMLRAVAEEFYEAAVMKKINPKMWGENEVMVMEDWFDSKDFDWETRRKYRNMLMYLCEHSGNYIYKEMYKAKTLDEVEKSSSRIGTKPDSLSISLNITTDTLKVQVTHDGHISIENDRGATKLSELEYIIEEAKAFVKHRVSRKYRKGRASGPEPKGKTKTKTGLEALFSQSD